MLLNSLCRIVFSVSRKPWAMRAREYNEWSNLINIRIYLDCYADQGSARNDKVTMDLPFEIRI